MLASHAPAFEAAIQSGTRPERTWRICVQSRLRAPDRIARSAEPSLAKRDTPDTARASPAVLVSDVPPVYSRLELLVIGIGDRDPITLLRSGSRLARLRQWLFGIEAPRPFADRRLEALRFLAIAVRRPRSPAVEVEAALAAGITPDQIAQLRLRRR